MILGRGERGDRGEELDEDEAAVEKHLQQDLSRVDCCWRQDHGGARMGPKAGYVRSPRREALTTEEDEDKDEKTLSGFGLLSGLKTAEVGNPRPAV